MSERRNIDRSALHGILVNKYVEGRPHVVRLLDLSETGARVCCLLEPDSSADRFALELEVPGTSDRLWLWARQVWRRGRKQALSFSGLTEGDRSMLRALLETGEHLVPLRHPALPVGPS